MRGKRRMCAYEWGWEEKIHILYDEKYSFPTNAEHGSWAVIEIWIVNDTIIKNIS